MAYNVNYENSLLEDAMVHVVVVVVIYDITTQSLKTLTINPVVPHTVL